MNDEAKSRKARIQWALEQSENPCATLADLAQARHILLVSSSIEIESIANSAQESSVVTT